MNMKNLLINSVMLSSLIMAGCSDDESVAPSGETPFVNMEVAETYVGTQSPGDVWTWNLDKEQGHMTASWDYGTFDDTSDDIEVEGTFQTLPSGFIKVTITNAVPATAEIPTDGSAWFYAIEIPDMALIIKPEGSIKGDLITMVPEGDCSNIPGAYNYIITAPGNQSDFNAITEESFGYVDFVQSDQGFDISGYKFSLDCVNDGPCTDSGNIGGLPIASCVENGFIEITDGDKTIAQGQFTNSGSMIMDFGYGNGGVLALKASENATKDALLNNTYTGLAYLPKNNDEKIVPVSLSFSKNDLGNVVGTGHPFTDIESGTIDNNEGAVIIVQEVINGRVLGTMNFDNDAEVSTMAAALLVNGDNQIMVLSSYDEEGKDPIILVLAKQNQ